MEKSLPVEVWIKDKPFRFFCWEIFYYYISHIKTKNDIFKIFISLKTKILNELTLKTKFPKNKTNLKFFLNTHKSNKFHKPNIKHKTRNTKY